MNVLLIAPEPFYQPRGTPIAVSLLLDVLSKRGWSVDVLTYPEGEDRHYPGVRLFRVPSWPGTRGVRPGFSFKKLVCDTLIFFKAIRLVARKRYDLLHCVEESVFIGLALRPFLRRPYVYDMDSSMAQQVVEKHRWLRPLSPILRACEALAIRHAAVVVPVCDALVEIANRHRAARVIMLNDVSLLPPVPLSSPEAAKKELGLPKATCFVYVGNLEPYQGLDLLLGSFARFVGAGGDAVLAIAGGAPADVQKYAALAATLGVASAVHFLGERPVEELGRFMAAADVLVSPRIKGRNTPMKIYSYLDAGKAILATDILSHSQVLTPDVALLVPPQVEAFKHGMQRLATDADLRKRLGAGAKALAQERYSLAVFQRKANELCDAMETLVQGQKAP